MSSLLVMRKEILVDRSPIVYSRPFDAECLAQDWQVRGGEWTVIDGWLTGRNPLNAPGMVTSRRGHYTDVMLDFTARTVPPSTHDIDWMWNGSWDEAANERSVAYVAGLQGWWEGKVGIEKSPDYKLNVAAPLLGFEPGRAYHIQSGSVAGHVFVFVDGKLLLEVTDPEPIDSSRYGLIGFEAYASHIQVRDLAVHELVWQERDLEYAPEFWG